MATRRPGRPTARPSHRPPAPAAQEEIGFVGITPRLIACGKCAAVIADTDVARQMHAKFHEALRALWGRQS